MLQELFDANLEGLRRKFEFYEQSGQIFKNPGGKVKNPDKFGKNREGASGQKYRLADQAYIGIIRGPTVADLGQD